MKGNEPKGYNPTVTNRDKALRKVRRRIVKAGVAGIIVDLFRESVRLTGRVSTWDKKVAAGFAAANQGFKGVLNDIDVDGVIPEEPSLPLLKDSALEGKVFDVVIIGGGITGTAILRELTRYNISVALLEKEKDLAVHATSRNDGMVHPGFATKPGTKKAYYNARGNRMYTQLAKDLAVPFKRPGSLLLFHSPLIRLLAPLMRRRAYQNGVTEVRFLSRKSVREMEPNAREDQRGGLFLPSAGVISPYNLAIALAENGVQNGGKVFFETAVIGFLMKKRRIGEIRTNRGNLTAKVVINAAGIWADRIAEYADDRFFSLHGRKGVDCLLDISTGSTQTRIMSMPPILKRDPRTKGGGIVPTVEGNLLVGPNARETHEREIYSTTPQDIEDLLPKMAFNKKISKKDIITYFAGIRACTWEEDFIIEPSPRVANLVYAAGIQSPGLASAPAIAEGVVELTLEMLWKEGVVEKNENFNPKRFALPPLKSMTRDELSKAIKKRPDYGRVICRCEGVSEGEIRDALRSPLSVTTVNGIKRRTRGGMGRCHGGFCTPRIMEIMAEELDVPMTKIMKKGGASQILLHDTKGKVAYNRAIERIREGGNE
jgi:glycerol-3-phosphate dehydrogenase